MHSAQESYLMLVNKFAFNSQGHEITSFLKIETLEFSGLDTCSLGRWCAGQSHMSVMAPYIAPTLVFIVLRYYMIRYNIVKHIE